MAFIRKVKNSSGATAVQIAYKVNRHIVKIIHIGSVHNKEELDILVAVARKRLFADQLELLPQTNPLKIKTKRTFSALLRNTLKEQYAILGFTQLNDDVFEALCLARIVEPTLKLDSLRVLDDLGVDPLDRNQLYRCLAKASKQDYRKKIS
jgi:hypothetical protein